MLSKVVGVLFVYGSVCLAVEGCGSRFQPPRRVIRLDTSEAKAEANHSLESLLSAVGGALCL